MKDTLNTIKGNIYIRANELRLVTILSAIGFIFGHVILRLVLEFDNSADTTSFELGTVMAAMIILFFTATVSSANYSNNFNYALSMSRRRRDIITAHIVMSSIKSLLATSFIYIFHELESYICHTTYSQIPEDFNFDSIFTVGVFFAIFLFLIALETFMGAMMTRFGQKTFWIMWVVCVLGFTSIPSFVEQTIEGTANDIVATIGQFIIDIFSGMTMERLLIGICCVCVVLMLLPYMLLRKHRLEM